MDIYFARQPILDKNLRVFGYELLFRPGPDAQGAGNLRDIDGDYATSVVLAAASVGGLENVTGGTYAFVNFTENLLLEGIATLHPPNYLAIEVLEEIRVNERVLDAVRELREKGYLIALDDYVYQAGDEPFLELSDIIKVEVDGSAESYENLQTVIAKVDSDRCQILAEKVETQEIFDKSAKMGCTLFQGYFFAKPKTMMRKTVSSLKINRLRLMQEVIRPDIDKEAVADIIKSDVSLTYKILRLVNSAYFGIRNKISNINHAVVFLGSDELKKWVTYVTLTELNEDKASEIIIMSVVRGYFCETVAKMTHMEQDADAYFLIGLFSLLDTIVEAPLEECLKTITIPPLTREVLLEKDHSGREPLDLIIALENGNWDEVGRISKELGLDERNISTIYLDSIKQVRQFYGPTD